MFTELVKKITKLTLNDLVRAGLYLWLFVLPWQTRWIAIPRALQEQFWEYGTISLYASECVLLVVIALFVVDQIRQKKLEKFFQEIWQSLLSKKITLITLLSLAALWIALGSMWSLDPVVTTTRLGHALLAGVGFLLIGYVGLPWRRIVSVLIAAGLIQGWLAIMQFLDQEIAPNKWLGLAEQLPFQYGSSVVLADGERWLRAYGSFPHPNILSGFLTIVFLLTVHTVLRVTDTLKLAGKELKQKLYWYRVGLFGSLIFIVSGLLLSFSRAGWLATVFALTIVAAYIQVIQKKSYMTLFKIGIIMLLTTLLWVSVYPIPFQTRFQANQPLEKQSYEERVQSYEDSELILRQHWVYGTGLGTYTKAIAQEHDIKELSLLQPVHNSWLLVVSELGFIGLLLLLMWLVAIGRISEDRIWAVGLLSAVVILMLFDHWWISLVVGNTWFLVVSLLVALLPKQIE